jgi:hypothetical protein
MNDGSYFQLYYRAEGDRLVQGSLAYLPSPSILAVRGARYARFDCDIAAHRDIYHLGYHAHFGYGSQMRLPLMRFPMPSQFLDFVKVAIYCRDATVPGAVSRHIADLDRLGMRYAHVLCLR